jgi:hypothetical protein
MYCLSYESIDRDFPAKHKGSPREDERAK